MLSTYSTLWKLVDSALGKDYGVECRDGSEDKEAHRISWIDGSNWISSSTLSEASERGVCEGKVNSCTPGTTCRQILGQIVAAVN
jgi:hypothetical protein